MLLLGVNIDHIATVRQARGTRYPDPIYAAQEAETGGADGITVHLREDRRHIQERDVLLLQQTINTRLNLEIAATQAMLDFACQVKPAYVCLVPEKREELTTEGGLNVLGEQARLTKACKQLTDAGIQVSLFIDPNSEQIAAAHHCGAKIIEIHTGEYANATTHAEQLQQLEILQSAAKLAQGLKLQVNAGHGLHYHNIQAIAQIPEMVELNIGHSIVARALIVGMRQAVAEMKQLMTQARLQ